MTGLVLLLLGMLVGWKLINEPRVIYFSDRINRPRAEIWAGLLFGAAFLLTHLASQRHARIPLHFALWGALGGAIGFGGGGLWMSLGKTLPKDMQWISWWKLMEFTFGFCFGLGLGYAAWRKRTALLAIAANPNRQISRPTSIGLTLVIAAVLVLVALWLETNLEFVGTFTFIGVGLLILSINSEPLAWQNALTVTCGAFALDLAEYFYKEPMLGGAVPGFSFVVITTLVLGFIVARRERSGKPMITWAFLLLMWAAVLVSYAKSFMHPPPFESHGLIQGIFTLDAIILTWWFGRKVSARNTAA